MKALFLFLAMVVTGTLWAQKAEEDRPPEKMETYVFPVAPLPPGSYMYKESANEEENPFKVEPTPVEDQVQKTMERYGIRFPAGSSLVYEPLISAFISVNTEENQQKIYGFLQKVDLGGSQVYLSLQAIRIPQAVAVASEKKAGGPLRAAAVKRLWLEDKAAMLHSQGLLTQVGVNAIVDSGPASSIKGVLPNLSVNMTPTISKDRQQISVVVLLRPVDATKEHTFAFEALTSSVHLRDGEEVLLTHVTLADGDRVYLLLHARIEKAKWAPLEDLKMTPAASL